MKIKILFTFGNNPVSTMIRSVTEEPVSHVAVKFGGKIVHSNFLGLKIEETAEFFTFNHIFSFVEFEVDEDKFYERLSELKVNYKGYDFKALLYLGARYLLPKFLTKKINMWEVTNQYICTELVSYLLDGKADSMITPYQMYLQLAEKEAKNVT